MPYVTHLARYGPRAVIAGGCEGEGAEFAHQLAAAGINLVLIARKPEPLERTAPRAVAAVSTCERSPLI
jgi:short-subunit dehydrogenase